MALVSMKQSAEEAKEQSACCEPGDAPQFPYGLELSLDEEALAKLGITAPPAVGTTMMITAKVVVTRASSYQTQGNDPESSSAWQITDMECSSTGSTAAAALYPS